MHAGESKPSLPKNMRCKPQFLIWWVQNLVGSISMATEYRRIVYLFVAKMNDHSDECCIYIGGNSQVRD